MEGLIEKLRRNWVTAGVWACVILLAASVASVALAYDPESEPSIILCDTAGSSFGPYNPAKRETIWPSNDVQDATHIIGDDATYSWCTRLISGSQVCIFTADREGGKLVNIGGGRDCTSEHCHAYIMRGYHRYAVAGGSCASFGISECQGICE